MNAVAPTAAMVKRDNDSEVVAKVRRPLTDEQVESIETWGRKIAVQMVHGNRLAAHELVDKGLATLAEENRSPLLDTPLAELGVSVRVCNALERHLGITTIGGALNTTSGELLMVPNFGPESVYELMSFLLKFTVNRVIELEENRAEAKGSL